MIFEQSLQNTGTFVESEALYRDSKPTQTDRERQAMDSAVHPQTELSLIEALRRVEAMAYQKAVREYSPELAERFGAAGNPTLRPDALRSPPAQIGRGL